MVKKKDHERTENPAAAAETFDVEDKGKKKGKKKQKKGKTETGETVERKLASRAERERTGKSWKDVTWTTEPRRCQDCSCCIGMLVYWAAMVWIAIYSAQNGDWKRLVVPQDKYKHSCGMDNKPDPANCKDGNCNFNNCPFLYFANPVGKPEDVRCVEACPKESGDIVCDCGYCNNGSTWSRTQLLLGLAEDNEHFTFNMVPTTKAVLVCLPSGNLTESAEQAKNANPWFETAITDLHQNWRGVVLGMGSSFFVGFIFLYAVAFLTKPLTYIIITGTMIASFCLCLVSLVESGRLPKVIQDVVRDIVKDSNAIVLPAEGAEPEAVVDFFCIFTSFHFFTFFLWVFQYNALDSQFCKSVCIYQVFC